MTASDCLCSNNIINHFSDLYTDAQIPEELTLDYAEITSIPPLPLWTLLAADKETLSSQKTEDVKDYEELFDGNFTQEESLDDLLDDESESPRRLDRRSSIPERQGLSHFGPRQGQLLSRLLTHTHLPGLSSLDQMHLLALADTVSTCNTDFAEKFVIDAAKTAIAKENLTGMPDTGNVSTDSLDDCGLRFLLAMKHFSYLLRCLPLRERNSFQKQGVGTSNLVWAFHSESEEELLNMIPSYAKGQAKWSTLKELGVGWWLRSTTLLKTCIERLAKAAYQQKQDPMDAALYYIAMKKKNLVWGLYRSKRDDKMTSFFANNFSEERWRKAALKNAFALLGKQRFEHAVAFFLLANALNDALEVCLTKLEDLQLALVIARLYEGEHGDLTPPTYKKLLFENILGCDATGCNQILSKAHPDPFYRSMALWMLKDYSGSLNTLLLNNVGHYHPRYQDDDPAVKFDSAQSANPNVFNFYIYLRTHPLLIRQHIASTAQEKKKTQVMLSGFSYGNESTAPQSRADKQLQLEDSITPLERQLYFTTAHGHFKAGCPALALEVLSKLPSKVIDHDIESQMNSPNDKKNHDAQISTGILDWSATESAKKSMDAGGEEKSTNFDWNAPSSNSLDWGAPSVGGSAMDWGEPVSGQLANDSDGFKIEWDDEEDKAAAGSDEGSEDEGLNFKVKADLENVNTSTSPPEETNGNAAELSSQMDIMAQQLKFVACLKILMEELSTLATGFEVDGGQLRYQLYVWLEREVEALRQLCNYSCTDPGAVSTMEENTTTLDGQTMETASAIPHQRPSTTEKPSLHEILMQEKQDFEAKVQRAARRKRWLKGRFYLSLLIY